MPVWIASASRRRISAETVCRAGADLINDAWGGYDPGLAEVAARYRVGLVCTHTGGAAPRTVPRRAVYAKAWDEVKAA